MYHCDLCSTVPVLMGHTQSWASTARPRSILQGLSHTQERAAGSWPGPCLRTVCEEWPCLADKQQGHEETGVFWGEQACRGPDGRLPG